MAQSGNSWGQHRGQWAQTEEKLFRVLLVFKLTEGEATWFSLTIQTLLCYRQSECFSFLTVSLKADTEFFTSEPQRGLL